MMGVMENISTRSDANPIAYSNVTWTNIVAIGLLMLNSYRVSSVGYADIIALASVSLEIAV